MPDSRWSLYLDVGFMYLCWVCFSVAVVVIVPARQTILILCYTPQIDALIASDVLQQHPVNEGLSQELIDAIPEVTGKKGEVCSICLEPYSAGVLAKQLPTCSHQFHKNCIALWLLRSKICPFCKQQITEEAIRGLQAAQ